MRSTVQKFGWLVCLVPLVVMFGGSVGAQAGDSPDQLPLLAPGLHLGSTFYGGGEIPDDPALRQVVADAGEEGLTAFTLYAEWPTLEPSAGSYALEELQATLAWLHGMGYQPLLNITLIDIADLMLVDDLMNDDGSAPSDGLTFDDPLVISRLNALLDQVVPLLVEHGGFLLLLGNEVDEYFADYPAADPAGYAALIDAARQHVHSIAPQLAVGVTLTGTEVLEEGELLSLLRPVTDVLPFNFYPLYTDTEDWLMLMDEAQTAAAIEQLMAVYENETVVIQELGCPSATANGSSLDLQAACFDQLLGMLSDYPNVRYATVFTLHDFDDEVCDLFVDVFGLTERDLPDGWFPRWRGYLCSLGILNADYSPKPAWDVVLSYTQ